MSKVSLQELAKELEVPAKCLLQVLLELKVSEEEAQAGLEKETAQMVKELAQELGAELRTLPLPPQVTVRDLAQALEVPPTEIQKRLMKQGVLVGVNQRLAQEIVENLLAESGLKVRWVEPQAVAARPRKPPKVTGAQPRPPVVTILGHVDHGKTTLLDYIRKTQVAEHEFGGITQHIGAYQAKVGDKLITFLDTPGHEAFTAMRARGAQVTDIAVLVVAADDGVMPQTIEALNHARNAKVPIIVAINKIDKPEANPQRVKQQLAEQGLLPEEWGGNTVMIELSAKTGQGVDHLLEMILLVAELEELQADPCAPFEGSVLEAKLEKGRGPVATVLVQQGTLRVGDVVVVGSTWGRVRAMFDYQGQRVEQALPAMPVEIIGLESVPIAGDKVEVVHNETYARQLTEERIQTQREQRFRRQAHRRIRLEDLFKQIETGEIKELAFILKADVWGSAEAVRDTLLKMEKPKGVEIKDIHTGVGNITESDVQLALVANAIILGFNVKVEPKVQQLAKDEGVEIRTYKIIYELKEDVQKALKGLLQPRYEEVIQGKAEVRAVFRLSRGITVAGCYVSEGKIYRNYLARLKRGTEIVYEGKIVSLRHHKEDVREIAAGYECGIVLENFHDYREHDQIECYQLLEVEPG